MGIINRAAPPYESLVFEDICYSVSVKVVAPTGEAAPATDAGDASGTARATALRGMAEEAASGRKKLLRGISGVVRKGELLAIMGPSGCGKTSLLDVLAGRVSSSSVEGRVMVDGKPRDRYFRRGSAYVRQELTLTASLSVTETLMYAARLRLPEELTEEDRVAIVESTIDQLGLRVAAHTKIGNAFIRGVSGGQKRRVAIGCELVAFPHVLFLDVPTSGLDSTTALSIIELLKQLALSGKMVVTTINQPNAKTYALFDRVLLMSRGRQMFFGAPHRALDFFANQHIPCPKLANPADYYLTKINDDFANSADIYELEQGFVHSRCRQEMLDEMHTVAPETSSGVKALEAARQEQKQAALAASGTGGSHDVHRYATSFMTQLKILLTRNMLDALRNPILYWIRVVRHRVVASCFTRLLSPLICP
jgi:ABC-type multidrug transport system ATPase subunit